MRAVSSFLLRGAGVLLLLACPAPAGAEEIWVVTQGSRHVFIIDSATNLVVDSINVGDPDGDLLPEVPAGGLAFSSVPDNGSGHGFITYQDGTLAVLDVAARSVLHSFDLRTILSASSCHPDPISGLTLAGAESSVPREFTGPGGAVIKSYLFVAATTSTGKALGVALDQEVLIAGGPAPLVGCVTLGQPATALDVEVLEAPSGDRHLRAWFAVSDAAGTALAATLIFMPESLGGPLTVTGQQFTMGSPAPIHPELMKPIGAPYGRELPVWARLAGTSLQNLDSGGECPLAFTPIEVAVTGVGPNSYEVWALNVDTGELVEIDPTNCDPCVNTVGQQPVDVAFLDDIRFRSAFTADYLSDSVTRVDKDGTITTIPLAPPGAACVHCPVAIAVAGPPPCNVRLTTVEAQDTDEDDVVDTIHLEWNPTACGDGREYTIACQCMDSDPDCPCLCPCPDPLGVCDCPGLCLAAPPTEGGGEVLLPPPWEPIASKYPWRPLGFTSETSFDHPVDGTDESGTAYNVTPDGP